jgi:citronellol/citronellal dehydrogenase
MERLAVLGS